MVLIIFSLICFWFAWKTLASLHLGTALINSLYSLANKFDQINHRLDTITAELQAKLDLKNAQKAAKKASKKR